ncbi:MAG TPA: DUF6069 family protein [Mycobacterium sp.]|jgi:hypothetical protein|nr:DUF6069 family protein [Mycobacterium sp.]
MTSGWPPEEFDQSAGATVRPQVDSGKLWAGGLTTALVAALIAVVGIVIARGIFHVPVLAPKKAGTWGDADTITYALAAFGIALVATALIQLLLLFVPTPYTFFGWIMALATLVAVLAPFVSNAEISSKVCTALINAAIGICIWSLTAGTARRSMRRATQPGRYGG